MILLLWPGKSFTLLLYCRKKRRIKNKTEALRQKYPLVKQWFSALYNYQFVALRKTPPQESCSNKMQPPTKKVHIEQQKKVLRKREEGSVKGKGRAGWALCVPYLGLGVTMWCVAIRCVLSGFSGNSRGRSQLTHTHARARTHTRTHVQSYTTDITTSAFANMWKHSSPHKTT